MGSMTLVILLLGVLTHDRTSALPVPDADADPQVLALGALGAAVGVALAEEAVVGGLEVAAVEAIPALAEYGWLARLTGRAAAGAVGEAATVGCFGYFGCFGWGRK